MLGVSINQRVEQIKNNPKEINRLIEEYKPFIASCTEKVAGRYVRYGEDDELSIALMAFAEAIGSYHAQKGNFLSFSQHVIRRRIIDYYRKENKHNKNVPLHEWTEEENEMDYSVGQALDNYTKETISEYRRLELLQYKKELADWDISFLELAEASPKHGSTRKIYTDIIRFLLKREDLLKQVSQKKYLPIAEIEKCTGIPRKKIERARKYVIAILIIESGDYQYIRDYVQWG